MQAGGGKLGDAGQHVGTPGLRVDVVEASGRNQGQHDGGPVCAAIGTGEAPIFLPQATPRRALSAALFVMQILPSSAYLAKSAQRDSM